MDSEPKVLMAIPLPVFPEAARKPKERTEREGRRSNLENKITPIIRQIAEERGLLLIDIHGLLKDSPELCKDGVHYHDEAREKVAEAYAAALAEAFGENIFTEP